MNGESFNTRILIVDDEETVRNSFREILRPRRRQFAELDRAGAELFGDKQRERRSLEVFEFELDEAADGHRAIELVKAASEADRPYAAIFVDVRMPGWDGLETVRQIRTYDQHAEIIFVTAYSDYTIDEIVGQAGANVGYHTKPFAPEEIRQIATKAVYDWNKTRSLEQLIRIITRLRGDRVEVQSLLSNILHQVTELIGSTSALIATGAPETGYRKLLALGALADDEVASEYLGELPPLTDGRIYQTEHSIYLPLHKYNIIALFEGERHQLNSDRLYMMQLFLEQAAQVLQNAELQEQVLRQEKLSAVGQAVSMIAHDLRSPLSGVIALVELMERTGYDQHDLERSFSEIKTALHSVMDIVTDILDFTRKGELSRSLISSNDLLEQVEVGLRDIFAQFGIQLRIERREAFTFLGDDSKMRRVLTNLVRNACEAIGSNHNADAQVKIRSDYADGYGILQVADNGPGIPENALENLYVPFAGSSKHEGTGLGLAIVEHFVKAHDGLIEIETGDHGTMFTIKIPADRSALNPD